MIILTLESYTGLIDLVDWLHISTPGSSMAEQDLDRISGVGDILKRGMTRLNSKIAFHLEGSVKVDAERARVSSPVQA